MADVGTTGVNNEMKQFRVNRNLKIPNIPESAIFLEMNDQSTLQLLIILVPLRIPNILFLKILLQGLC